MKRKKQVARSLTVMIFGLVLMIAGFFFVFVSQSAALIVLDGKVGLDASFLIDVKDLLKPLTENGFRVIIEGMNGEISYLTGKVTWLPIIACGLTVIVFIITLIMAIFKRKGTLYVLSFLELVSGFLLFYVASAMDYSYIQVASNGGSFFKDLFYFMGICSVENQVLNANPITTVFIYLMIVGILLSIISMVWMFIVICIEPKKVKVVEMENVVEEEAPLITMQEEVKAEEPVQEEQEQPKRKVVLTVKRFDSYGESKTVVEKPTNYPQEPITVKALTKEDIRDILREELEKKEKDSYQKYYSSYVEEDNRKVKEINNEVVNTSADIASKDETKEIPTPVIVAIPTPIKEEKDEVVVEKKKTLSKDEIQSIIKDEIQSLLAELKDSKKEKELVKKEPRTIIVKIPRQVVKERIIEKEVLPIKEEPKVQEIQNVKEEPKEEKVTVVEEVPASNDAKEETPIIEETVTTVESTKVERIPFTTRMKDADSELKEHYNNLKSLLKSYGLKNRVANGGDTFRLHRVTYCKITIAGKALKLYFALDPEDYKNTTLPIKDSSGKAIYKDIPLVFKVKSDLSYRRAEQLVRDCMEKHGLEQIDQVKVEDWASRLEEEQANQTDDEE